MCRSVKHAFTVFERDISNSQAVKEMSAKVPAEHQEQLQRKIDLKEENMKPAGKKMHWYFGGKIQRHILYKYNNK